MSSDRGTTRNQDDSGPPSGETPASLQIDRIIAGGDGMARQSDGREPRPENAWRSNTPRSTHNGFAPVFFA